MSETIQKIKRTNLLLLAALIFGVNFLFVLSQLTSAANLTESMVRLNRMAAAQTTSFRLVFETVGAGATTASVDFTAAWASASGSVNATQTASSGTCAAETGATALPGTLSASGSSNTVSITGITALSATTKYCVDLTSASAVTNANAGEYYPVITVGSDSTTIAVRTVTNDQIVVTATVPPSFNFVLDSNTDTFASNLAPGSVVNTNGRTVTVNTNATTGWIAWARDSNTGLTSAAASHTIPSTTPGTNATLSAGTPGYVFAITAITQGTGAGTTTASNAYGNGAGGVAGAGQGSGLDSSIRQIASSTGTANGAVLTVRERAAISAVTPAATDYTDTITIIGAGSF
jgi:hypothetical protein